MRVFFLSLLVGIAVVGWAEEECQEQPTRQCERCGGCEQCCRCQCRCRMRCPWRSSAELEIEEKRTDVDWPGKRNNPVVDAVNY